MTISVHLAPSTPEEHEPGHMAAAWARVPDARHFRGFVFDVSDLPEEFQTAERWRDYLFDHTVPGHVIQDKRMAALVRHRRGSLLSQEWAAEPAQVRELESLTKTGQTGRYSFNPDDHPGCHNCVTWATEVVNNALGQVLPRVRQGRIKLMAEVLRAQPNKPEPA